MVLACFPEPAAAGGGPVPATTGKRRAGAGSAAAAAPGPGPGLRRVFKFFEAFLRQSPAFGLAAAAMGVLGAVASRAKCALLGRDLSGHALWCLQQVETATSTIFTVTSPHNIPRSSSRTPSPPPMHLNPFHHSPRFFALPPRPPKGALLISPPTFLP